MGDPRSALIVATSKYSDARLPPLEAPRLDAGALKKVLGNEDIGAFAVRVASNFKVQTLRLALESFFADRSRDDLLLVHFSCHGLKDDEGQLYLAAADTKVGRLRASAIDAEWLRRLMDDCRSERIAVFLDCCFGGAFASTMTRRDGLDTPGIKEHLEGTGRVVITASNAIQYSFEGGNRLGTPEPSAFTRALVDGLATGDADRNRDGRVTINELFDYLADKVRETSPSQTPTKWEFNLAGDWEIARSRRASVQMLPADLQSLVASPDNVHRLAAITELRNLLTSPDTLIAQSAELAVQQLAGDDSFKVSSAAKILLGDVPAKDAPPARAPHVRKVPSATRTSPPAGETEPSRATPPQAPTETTDSPTDSVAVVPVAPTTPPVPGKVDDATEPVDPEAGRLAALEADRARVEQERRQLEAERARAEAERLSAIEAERTRAEALQRAALDAERAERERRQREAERARAEEERLAALEAQLHAEHEAAEAADRRAAAEAQRIRRKRSRSRYVRIGAPILVVGVALGGAAAGLGCLGRCQPGESAAPSGPAATAAASVPAGAASGQPAASAAVPPVVPPGMIVFTAQTGSNSDLWVAAPDGSGMRPLVQGTAVQTDSYWSPDRAQVVYRDPAVGLKIVTNQGKFVTNFTHHGRDTNPAWSPLRTQIAFASDRSTDSLEIYTRQLNAQTDAPHAVVTNPVDDWDPSWSPDEKRIAYVTMHSGRAAIYLVDVATRKQEPLTTDGAIYDDPAWSPDGTWIAFTRRATKSDPKAVWIMPSGGGKMQPVTASGVTENDPTWSPDSKFLAFGRENAKAQIIVTDLNGNQLFAFGRDGAANGWPDWQ